MKLKLLKINLLAIAIALCIGCADAKAVHKPQPTYIHFVEMTSDKEGFAKVQIDELTFSVSFYKTDGYIDSLSIINAVDKDGDIYTDFSVEAHQALASVLTNELGAAE